MPDVWDPPADTSGGYFICSYTNGVYTHRARYHFNHCDVVDLTYTDLIGSEVNVSDTINHLLDVLKAFWTPAWTLTLQSVWVMVAGVPTPHEPPPVITPRPGTSLLAEATDPAGEYVFSIRSTNGGRFKAIMVAPAGWTNQSPEIGTSATSGAVGGLMTYLVSNDSEIRAHDNGKPIDYAHITSPYNRRLRRHYHLD